MYDQYAVTTDEVQLLRKAQEVLIEFGWTQGTGGEEQGFCALGAVNKAARLLWGDDRWHHDQRHVTTFHDALAPVHELARKAGYKNIIAYNDNPNTTERKVRNIFRKAAEQLAEDVETWRYEDD